MPGQILIHSSFGDERFSTRICLTGREESSPLLQSADDSWRCLSIDQSVNPLVSLFAIYAIICFLFSLMIYIIDSILHTIAYSIVYFLHQYHHHHHRHH